MRGKESDGNRSVPRSKNPPSDKKEKIHLKLEREKRQKKNREKNKSTNEAIACVLIEISGQT